MAAAACKNLVAARMAVLVVDFLEAVKIESDQAEGMSVAAGAVEFFVKSFVEKTAIVEAGQADR